MRRINDDLGILSLWTTYLRHKCLKKDLLVNYPARPMVSMNRCKSDDVSSETVEWSAKMQ